MYTNQINLFRMKKIIVIVGRATQAEVKTFIDNLKAAKVANRETITQMNTSMSVKKCIARAIERKPDAIIYLKVKGHMLSEYSHELIMKCKDVIPKQIAFETEKLNISLPAMNHVQPVNSYHGVVVTLAPSEEIVKKEIAA